MQTLKTAAAALAFILLLDAAGLTAWILSGQTPADGCYIGSMTATIIKTVLALF